jgi:glycosyltransferase involved in cell wall biosynthesis
MNNASATNPHRDSLRVIHVSTSDIGGGAAVSAYRLHTGLRRIGIDSQMLVNFKISDDFSVHGPAGNIAKIWARVANQIDQIPRKFFTTLNTSLLSPAWLWENTVSRIRALQPDIVNLHWTQNSFLRPESLRRLTDVPIVWTLHDMWAFCGAEHYVGDDTRYKNGYSVNNRPAGESGFDLNRWVWKRKRKSWKNLTNISIVTPSSWLGSCARESVLFQQRRVEIIPYGIDISVFKPLNKDAARNAFNLPRDKKIIVFGAMSATDDKRKGFPLLSPIFARLAKYYSAMDMAIAIFGSSEPRQKTEFGFPTYYLGRLHDSVSISLAYSAADVFIAPSMEDNLPNTVLEALACGVPAVAFDIGGMPDMILHQKNGWLAPAFNTENFADGIRWILESQERYHQLSTFARERSEEYFPLERQAQFYLNLYRELLGLQ